MKRILILTVTLISIVMLSVLPAGAAESFDLIPKDAYWTKNDNGGASVVVEESDGIFVFSGSLPGTWPCADTWYATSPIVASVEDYSLVFDFIVEGGATNINFFFDDGNGGNVGYTICNTALDPVSYDTGSGDLKDGTYRGAIKLSDFVNSQKLLNNETFPANAIIDGSLKFIGIQIYSVNGAKIIISKMAIVHNDDVAAALPSDEPSQEPSDEPSQEPVSSEEPDLPAEESDAVSDEAGDENTQPAEVSPEDSKADNPEQGAEDSKESTSVFVTIIAVVAILICLVITVILLKRKQSRQ